MSHQPLDANSSFKGFLAGPVFYALVVLLLCARFAYLDQDPPDLIVGYMWPGDEVAYNFGALNVYDHGSIHHRDEASGKNIEVLINGGIATVLTWFSLIFFGKTLFAIRLPAVVVSVAISAFSWLVLRRGPSQPFSRLLFLYLLVDFSFLVVSRFPTPTLYSMLMLSLLALAIAPLRTPETPVSFRHFFVLGFLALFSLQVYIYSLFFAISGLCVTGILALRKGLSRGFFPLVLGMMTAMALYFFCLWLSDCTIVDVGNRFRDERCRSRFFEAIDQSPERSLFAATVQFFGKAAQRVPEAIKKLVTTNFFRFNPHVLFLALFLPLFFRFGYRDPFRLFLILSLILCIAQLSFESAFSERKMIPCLLIVLFLASTFSPEDLLNVLRDWRKTSPIAFFSMIIAAFLVSLLVIGITNKNPTYLYYFMIGVAGKHAPRAIVIMGFLIACFYFFHAFALPHINRARLVCCGILFLVPNILLDIRYFGHDRKYFYREFLSSLAQYTNGKKVIGGDRNQLYNSLIPLGEGLSDQRIDTLFSTGEAEFLMVQYYPGEFGPFASTKGDSMRQGKTYRIETVASFSLPMGNYLLGRATVFKSPN